MRRLREPEHYRRALKAERRAGNWFVVYAAPNSGVGSRLGIVIARRVAPRAVDRSALRRLIREAFRQCPERGQPLDVVVRLARLPRPSDRRGVAAEICSLFERIL